MNVTQLMAHLNTSPDIIAGQCTAGREFLSAFRHNAELHHLSSDFLSRLKLTVAQGHAGAYRAPGEIPSEADLVDRVPVDVREICQNVGKVCRQISEMVGETTTACRYDGIIGSFLSEFTVKRAEDNWMKRV